MRLRSSPIVSSLQLQRLLHLNLYYSFVYAAAEVGLTIYKLQTFVFEDRVKYSLPVLVGVWCAAELARLPLGYVGNLREKVSSPAQHGTGAFNNGHRVYRILFAEFAPPSLS